MSETTATQYNELPRRQIRYWCFRFRTEAYGGAAADGAPDGLREHFEALPWFPGWRTFSEQWDVVPERPLDIKPLRESVEDAWNREAWQNARELPRSDEE